MHAPSEGNAGIGEPRRKLYGRRKGPKLSAHQAGLVETLLPRLKVQLRKDSDPKTCFDSPVDDVWLEIGFGAGEHLVWQVEHHPNIGIIGAEPYESGVAKLLSKLNALPPGARSSFPSPASGGGAEHAQACEAEGVRRVAQALPPPSRLPGERPGRLDTPHQVRGRLSPAPLCFAGEGNRSGTPSPVNPVERERADLLARIRLYTGDAREIIDALPDASLGRVFLLFPDPWPKKRHHKRRFIQMETLDALARVMKPGAEFRFASDDAGYASWTLEHAMAHRSFAWPAKRPRDWLLRVEDWPATRYELKELHGKPIFLSFFRKHQASAAG